MSNEIAFDYSNELDILHVYTSDIKEGIKECLTSGYFNVDVGTNDKIIGVEVESASKVFNISSEILSNLDHAHLLIRKMGNGIFIGVSVSKGAQKSFIQFNVSQDRTEASIPN